MCSSDLLTTPAAPAITVTVVNSNICGSRIVRYAGSDPKAATTTTAPSTGYAWVLPTGAIGTNCVLDSGSLSGQVIRIRYVSNAAASQDTVKLAYTSACGNSPQVNSPVTLAALNPPAAPSINSEIVIANVCGGRVVRYRASAPLEIGRAHV